MLGLDGLLIALFDKLEFLLIVCKVKLGNNNAIAGLVLKQRYPRRNKLRAVLVLLCYPVYSVLHVDGIALDGGANVLERFRFIGFKASDIDNPLDVYLQFIELIVVKSEVVLLSQAKERLIDHPIPDRERRKLTLLVPLPLLPLLILAFGYKTCG